MFLGQNSNNNTSPGSRKLSSLTSCLSVLLLRFPLDWRMAHVITIVFKIVGFGSEKNNRFLSTTHWAAFSRCLGAPHAHKQHTSTHQVTAQHDDLSAPSKTSRHNPPLPSNQNEENLFNTLSQKRAYAEPKPHQAVLTASNGPWDITGGTAWSCGGKTEKAMTHSRFHCKTEGEKNKKAIWTSTGFSWKSQCPAAVF